jgi:acetyl-CoA carboxylase alpha subunit
MSLTTDDLQAIRDIVEDVVETKVEAAKRQTAAGFAAVDKQFIKVHNRFDKLEHAVDRIERVQRAEIERNDQQDQAIRHMRRALHAA